MRTNLPIVFFLGVALIALGACGGGGGNDEAQLRTDLEAAQAAQAEAEAARKKAEEETAVAEAARKKAEEEAAEAERQRLVEEGEAEDEAEQERLAAEEAEQERLAADADRQRLANEVEQVRQQLTEAEQAELMARASSFGLELDEPALGMVDVMWPRDGDLTFRPEGTLTSGSAAPSVPGSWRSASFTGQTGTAAGLTNETVYLYTNIEKGSSRAFWKEHGLEVAASAEDNETYNPKPTAAAQFITKSGDSTMADGVRVRGNYDGVTGTFTCTVADTCMGTKTSINLTELVLLTDGVRSFEDGNWSFKPGRITSPVQADLDDAYLYLGVWASIPDSISGTTYDFKYVAGGGAESGTALTNFNALTGSATFRGGAVGKYVIQGQVGPQNAKIGTFTATATLNANFGNGMDPGSLSGSITDFSEGGSPLAGWRVTLGSTDDVGVASNITITNAAEADAIGSTVASIGGLPVGGSWEASFYGSDNAVIPDADRDKYPATRYPVVDLAGVAGWFDAADEACSNACLAGSFAATPQ